VNVDFETRLVKEQHTQLDFIRIGTSGAIRKDVPLDSIVISKSALGFDGLLHYYESAAVRNKSLESVVTMTPPPYGIDSDSELYRLFSKLGIAGITLTATGFYGPQARHLRLKPAYDFITQFSTLSHQNVPFTNLEMETAGIYGLSKLLGHRAISLNAILANRAGNKFSSQPKVTVRNLIESTLSIISTEV